jgi:MFS transporter, putative metabolite transport protein
LGLFDKKQLVPAKTVQQYIDEVPIWADGTPLEKPPLTGMQLRIWLLAVAGKFFEGLVVFTTGVALPLMKKEFMMTPSQSGIVGATSLFGILIGATALGSLSDRFGRKEIFIFESFLFVVFLALLTLSSSFVMLVVCLFCVGLALGCDYPTAHLVISESIPSRYRGALVLGAFTFQAVGALVGTVTGFIILGHSSSLSDWRWMYGLAIIPGLLVALGRFFVTQSPQWLASHGRIKEACQQTRELLQRNPAYPKDIEIQQPSDGDDPGKEQGSFLKLFQKKKNRRATIFASLPWFIQDLSTYGIGIFTPVILSKIVGTADSAPSTISQIVHTDMLATKGAAMIDLLLLVGSILAIFLVDRFGRIKLQIFGFIGCAIGLLIAALSYNFSAGGRLVCIYIGFMIFNFMTNLGPNSMTYLLAGEVFPTKIRGTGAGFAASFAKIGAVLTAFCFPILLKTIGTQALISLLALTALLGAWITWHYRIETNGIDLEKVDSES